MKTDRVPSVVAIVIATLIAEAVVVTIQLAPLFGAYRQITVAGGGWVTP